MIELVCLKCHSKEVMTGIGLMTNTTDGNKIAELFIDEDPDAIFFKSRITSALNARVCSVCGFVEFYAQDPGKLKEAHDRIMQKLAGMISRGKSKFPPK
ncbi:MAG: hypothetical protein KA109_12595 [Saprospiraceae bacterium]|nr:hypothetical protein [Saprospiraceae bacterium]MBK6481056.1 hypothetical protein [Saprospiraceae bacterium]MBK6815541.1 hypothetical protein [Saprospiraceae bacterium]MBK7372570.1 hypothetical protein [Saprospiraceae bacterium]MBK7439209.1 hypothetical protein [Saprospiraceae bacterium]